MPGNDPEIIHNFFEQDYSSQGCESQAGGGSWPILNNNPWVGIQRQNGPQLPFNATTYTSQSTDSDHGEGMQHVQTPFGSKSSKKAELNRSQSINQELNLNGCMHGSQGLQADHAVSGHGLMQRGFSNFESQQTSTLGYNSALTRSSERPEATEAPVNFDFLGGQQLVRSPHPGISESHSIQPQWINDMQLWQQHMIYKQLQQQQQQQQLLQLQQGIKQQNLLGQLSNVGRQASSNQVLSVLGGMPVSNEPNTLWSNETVGGDQRLPSSSPMFLPGNMNWVERSSMQGIPNGFVFSQDQGQAEGTMGFAPHQPDQSLYGTPVARTRGSPSHQSQFHGNFQQLNHVSPSLQIQEMSGSLHEKAAEQVGPSCGVSNLDTEEKLLFSTDDNGNQGISFGVNSDRSTEGYHQENVLQTNDYFSSFPTLNSGSWSALMQEAVEASSSDAGLNEEWSGLNFHKTKLSSGNPSAMLHDNNGNQQATRDDKNLQNASYLSSRPLPLFNETATSSNCDSTPNFQQPMNFSCQQNEGVVASHEFFQQSSKEAINKPFDQRHQQKQPMGVNVQTHRQFNNIYNGVWAGQTSEQTAGPAHYSELEVSSHSIQHCWVNQNIPLHSHSSNKPNGWNKQSLAPSGDKASNCYAGVDKRHHVQANDMNRTINMQTDHAGHMLKVNGSQVARSFPISAGGSETVEANTGSLMIDNEDAYSGNLAVAMNSSNLNLNQETNQQVLNRHQVGYGKHVVNDAFFQNEKEEFAIKHQNQQSTMQMWDSSMYNTNQRSGVSCNRKQESRHADDVLSEGFIHGTAQPAQNTKGGVRAVESSLLARNGTQSLVNSSLKFSGKSERRNIGHRRFQFHPMGNLEMNTEPVDSQSHTLHSQGPSAGLKNQDQDYVGHTPFSSHAMNNDLDMEKGHLNELQRNAKAAEETKYGGFLSNHSATSTIEGSTSEFSQNIRTGLTSQDMLELLHKVDQSKTAKPVEPSGCEQNTLSGRCEAKTSDESSSHLQLSRSPSFQGFSLNLAPPSQRHFVSDQASPLQTSLQTANGLNQRSVDSGVSEEDQATPPSLTSGQSLPSSHETSQKESQGDVCFPPEHKNKEDQFSNFQGNSLAAAAYAQKRLQSCDGATANPSSVAPMPHSSRLHSSSDTCQFSTGQSQPIITSSHLRSSGQHKPAVETTSLAHPSATSAMSQQGGISTRLRNVWMSISSQQCLSGVPPQKIISNVLQSKNPFSRDRESLQALRKLDNHNKRKGESSPSESSTSANSQQFTCAEDNSTKDNSSQQMPPPDTVDVDPEKGSASRGPVPEPEKKCHSDGNPDVSLSRVASSSRNAVAYGHPLGVAGAQKQNNYSLLQQMQVMKGAESDPTQRSGKRLKGTDFNMDASQMSRPGQRYIYGQNTVLREMDATLQNTSFPSDVRMLSFSSRDSKDNSTNMSLQVINREVPSHNQLTRKQYYPQNHSHPHGKTSMVPSTGGSEHSQISPQMAPSWFEKYGNCKNGQSLTTYDGVGSFERNVKASVQNYVLPKVSESMVQCVVPEEKDDANLVGSLRQSTSPTALLPNHCVSSPCHSQLEVIDNNMILVPKKCKSATSDLVPWHKEVTQRFRRLQSISIMEQKWAWATNRLVDKLEEEFETIEDGLSMARSRRRLILTAQLMQQIFPTVPSRFLCANAALSYESIINLMAKSILGDACSLTYSGSDSRADLSSENKTLEKHTISEKEECNHFSWFVEEVIGRSKKMENDFPRLDSRVSILDVRLECQDLERNSIMNRFAKFHGHAQIEGIESSSNSGTAPHRAFLQRHVTAHAMPGSLPEGVICLSL